MGIYIRQALITDVDSIFEIRTSVTENHLSREEMRQMGITERSVADMIQKSTCAWVAMDGVKAVGFTMVLHDKGCLFAAFVFPEYEGKGIGRELLMRAEEELFKHHEVIWLETDINSRAARIYKHLGWGNKTDIDENHIRLEKKRMYHYS
ncbi:GNAT family N-acetyltransferase [Salmonella enterica subsp. enterica]|nr:GNAT family N-acetyltransferase [Salmonella enterica subsp. enterica serovar Stanleyville]